MYYQITHNTTYRYSEPASLSQNELFLQPRETGGQRVVASRLEILPAPHYQHQRVDFFGNSVQMFMVQHPHSELQMTAVSEVETRPLPVPRTELTPPWEDVAATLAQPAGIEDFQACQFLFASPLISLDEAVTAYARSSFFPGRPILAGALDLIGRIFADFRYDKAATTVFGCRSAYQPQRGLSGFRPPLYQRPARHWPGRPVCQRLPGDNPATWKRKNGRCRRLPCLAGALCTGSGLG